MSYMLQALAQSRVRECVSQIMNLPHLILSFNAGAGTTSFSNQHRHEAGSVLQQ
jgi:hypothetical protein